MSERCSMAPWFVRTAEAVEGVGEGSASPVIKRDVVTLDSGSLTLPVPRGGLHGSGASQKLNGVIGMFDLVRT